MPQRFRDNYCNLQTYERNNVVTFSELSNPPKILRVYATENSDVQAAKRVLFQGTDTSDNVIYTQDVLNEVQGEFVTLDNPFIDSTYQYNTLTGIQKDITSGQVQIFQVDPTTGVESLMLTMEPTEQVAGYRRYYINNLPADCCRATNTPALLQVTAIAKLELIPVMVDTDYLLFHNLEAIIEEAQSVRYSEIDKSEAKQMAQEKHLQAVRLLQGELVHYLGKDRPAVSFAPFGSARLERAGIGTQL
jgi:hypothetical protein